MAPFFADQQKPVPLPTLEAEVEASVKRDRWNRPLIQQADGSTKPYSRASSYGSNIEDNSNIARWQQQQVVRGLAMRPSLLDAVPDVAKGDPWAGLEKRDKTALTRIADQAQDLAGSNLKSALGTDIHAATEYVDLGDSLDGKFDDMEPWRRELLIERANAYYAAVTDWGLKWDSVETFCVQDEVQVAGTYDRRGFVPWWPRTRQVIGDVKTSSSLDFAGIGFSVQLSVYAHGLLYDIATGERTPHDDMNLDRALIVHVDRNKGGPVTLAEVNIAAGWSYAMLARQILVARREGKAHVHELDQREVILMMATSRADLVAMMDEIKSWPQWLRDKANERFNEVK